MTEEVKMQRMETSTTCRHLWQPLADAKRIWQVCLYCHAEEHVEYHSVATARAIADIFRDSASSATAESEES